MARAIRASGHPKPKPKPKPELPRQQAAVSSTPPNEYVRIVAEHAGDLPRFKGDMGMQRNPEVKYVFDLLLIGGRIEPQMYFGYHLSGVDKFPVVLRPIGDTGKGSIDFGSGLEEPHHGTNLFGKEIAVGEYFHASNGTFRITEVNVLLRGAQC